MSPRTMIAAMVVMVAAQLARGQLVPDPNAQPNPQDATRNALVNVNDSTLAIDQINLAQRLAAEKDWPKSSEVYQGVIEKYRDRVVPSHAGEDGVVDRYTSVLSLINEQLGNWPPEGLAAYRTKFELPAKALVDSAHDDDLAPLNEAFTKYFATDAGKLAGLKLIDAYFELGDFSAASWTAQELLHHPNIEADRAAVLFRAGLSAHLAGDESAARASLSELNDKFANAVGTVGGHDVTLATELKADISRTTGAVISDQPTSAGADSWTTFGGDAGRSKSFVSTARPQARLYSVALAQPNWNVIPNPEVRRQVEQQDHTYRVQGRAEGVMPVADRGQLFFQNGSSIYARDLDTGSPLPGWMATYPQTGGSYVLPKSWNLPKGFQYCLTLTDRAVFGVMNFSDAFDASNGPSMNLKPTLVCLDRESGRQLWKLTPADLRDPQLKKLMFCGSVLAVGGNVYVAALQSKGDGYVDCYIICLDAGSGALRWSCYVDNALSTGLYTQSINQQLDPLLLDPTHLAYGSGRVYIATNLGAVAAIDAYSGVIHWLYIYRKDGDLPVPTYPQGFGGGFGRFGGGRFNPVFNQANSDATVKSLDALPPPWTSNAPILRDGNVFILPFDSGDIQILDAGDGHLVKHIPKDECCRLNTDGPGDSALLPETLLGVLSGTTINDGGKLKRADLLLLGTRARVFAIKWREFSSADPTAAVAWASASEPGVLISGRPFVTANSVLIPTSESLNHLDVHNGLTLLKYPAGEGWPAGEEPGNTIVCGDEVVVAGDKSVRVYTSLDIAQSRLDKEIAAAGNDPTPRLHFAEVMFLANQPAQAVKRLDEAVALLKSDASGQFSIAHDRAFDDALRFAVQGWQHPMPPGFADPIPPEQIEALFDRARQLAQWPSQKACYLLDRADYVRKRSGDLAAALKLYQAVLADNSLRTAVPFANDAQPVVAAPPPQAANFRTSNSARVSTYTSVSDNPGQAGKIAQDAIADLLSDARGHLAYGPFQQAAEAELAAATNAKDAARVAEVAAAYPNAPSVVRQALRTAADLAEKNSNYPFATWSLRQLYPRLEDKAQMVAVLQQMAQDYLRTPSLQGGGPQGGPAFRFEAAAGRLSVASRIDPAGTLKPPLYLPGSKDPQSRLPLNKALAAIDTLMDDPGPGRTDMPEIGLPSKDDAAAYHAKFGKNPRPLVPQENMALIPNVDRLLAMDQASARYDRVVTWTHGAGLSIYPLAHSEPLGTAAQVTDEPRGAAWVHDRSSLLVWTATGLTLIDGEKVKPAWHTETASLAPTTVLLQVSVAAQFSLLRSAGSNYPGRGGRGRMGPAWIPDQNKLQRLPMDALAGSSSDATESALDDAGETITGVVPLSDVAIVSTTNGRVAAIDLSSGEMRWQCRPVNRAADRVLANDDFTVVSAKSEGITQLVVFDTRAGKMLASQTYGEDAPINLALGDDGTLAWTVSDHIVMCDLQELSGDLKLQPTLPTTSLPMQNSPFSNFTRPGQILVRGREVLAVSQGGEIRRYSVESGQPRNLPVVLRTEDSTSEAVLRIGGGYLYAWGPASLAGYNLAKPGPNILTRIGPAGAVQLFLGKDVLLYFAHTNTVASSAVWMMAYSRATTSGGESGRIVCDGFSLDTHDVTAWQVVDGGVYYLAGDHSLYMLRGNRHPLDNTN